MILKPLILSSCFKQYLLLFLSLFSPLSRLKVYDVNSLLIDSSDIYDTSITGGRVGVFQFGQQMPLWSDLKVECLDRESLALYFNGSGDYVSLTDIGSLGIYHR